MNAIEIRNLTKRYRDVTAVDGLSLSVGEGEFLALLGVNGAGKTTTVKMLSCLVRPDGGDALLLGKSILTESDEVKKVIGVSPQETAVAQNLTVRENLELICGVFGLSKDRAREKCEELKNTFALQNVWEKKAGKLSGGWQRRVSIAMALVGEPQILFLDEPTLGLDVLARSELWDTITSLKGKMTLVLTTHYMEEAETLCDRIAIMKDGKLLALGSPDELKESTGTDTLEQAFIKTVKGETK